MDSRLDALVKLLDGSVVFQQDPSAGEVLRQLSGWQPGWTLVAQAGQIRAIASPPDAPVLLQIHSTPAPAELMAFGAESRWTRAGQSELVQGPYAIFAAAAERHFAGNLAGKLVLGCGLGGFGGALPLAATLNGAAFLGIECAAEKLKHRLRQGWIDFQVNDLDEALRILKNAVRKQQAVAVGLEADAAVAVPALARLGVVPDLAADATGPSAASIAAPWQSALRVLETLGAVVFRFDPPEAAGEWPSFLPHYLQPWLRRGLRPLRWFAPRASAAAMARLDATLREKLAAHAPLARWLKFYSNRFRDGAIPCRIAWLGQDEITPWKSAMQAALNNGTLPGPVVYASDDIHGRALQTSFFIAHESR